MRRRPHHGSVKLTFLVKRVVCAYKSSRSCVNSVVRYVVVDRCRCECVFCRTGGDRVHSVTQRCMTPPLKMNQPKKICKFTPSTWNVTGRMTAVTSRGRTFIVYSMACLCLFLPPRHWPGGQALCDNAS